MATRVIAQAEPIPGYRLIERIGRGGFGEVWKAEAPGGILKAIKFVFGNLKESRENGFPADQELKSLNRIKGIRHPYILSLERYDIVDGQLMIVMELAERNLHDRMRECQKTGLRGIPRDELLRYMAEIAEALDLMNSEYQIQHLDIKPHNVFLVHNHAKVADFGLAKDFEGKQATLTGGVTPLYAAPETFEGRVSRHCDQYSLAIVYQEILTALLPFTGETARQLMMQHVNGEPDVSPLSAGDQAAVRRALSKFPEERFSSCTEFVHALKTGESAPSCQNLAIPEPIRHRSPTPLKIPNVSQLLGIDSRKQNGKLPQLANRQTQRPGRILTRTDSKRITTRIVQRIEGTGLLQPSLIVGIGGNGIAVAAQLQQQIERKWKCKSLPCIRFLFLDSESDAFVKHSGNSDVNAADARNFLLTRLNRPSHYVIISSSSRACTGGCRRKHCTAFRGSRLLPEFVRLADSRFATTIANSAVGFAARWKQRRHTQQSRKAKQSPVWVRNRTTREFTSFAIWAAVLAAACSLMLPWSSVTSFGLWVSKTFGSREF